jgi:hypothetical protein
VLIVSSAAALRAPIFSNLFHKEHDNRGGWTSFGKLILAGGDASCHVQKTQAAPRKFARGFRWREEKRSSKQERIALSSLSSWSAFVATRHQTEGRDKDTDG